MRCGACGADMIVEGGRFVCPQCGFAGCHLDVLIAEFRKVRTKFAAAEDPHGSGWSPIRAACLEPDVHRLAREIADLLAAQPTASVLV